MAAAPESVFDRDLMARVEEEKSWTKNQRIYIGQAIRHYQTTVNKNEPIAGSMRCWMAYVDKGTLTWIADDSRDPDKGDRDRILRNRKDAGVELDKRTYCAEENVLATTPRKEFLFSFASSNSLRESYACRDCALLLRHNKIIDLVAWFGSKAKRPKG